MTKFIKQFLILFLIIIIIAVILNSIQKFSVYKKEVNISEIINQINNQNVKQLIIKPTSITAILKDNTYLFAWKESNISFFDILKAFNIDLQKIKDINLKTQEENLSYGFWFLNIISIFLPVIIIGFILFWVFKQVQTTSSRALMFGQSKIKKSENTNVSFKDVAGSEEAKEELKEIIEFLKNPQKFIKMGAKVPKGVLLIGPPGTGKTLLARAVANEANVPFFHISGSEFVEMFVGVGAARVRDAFNKAKKSAPSILFIDEIDAIGRHRGAGLGGSHDEREQTLNQILVEMDGFEPNTNLIVIAATNRPDILDPALLRPGRFDRRITLYLPTLSEREEILKVHAKGKPLSENISLKEIAERTPGFSGADLANLLNESAILAARKNKEKIEMQDILDSIEKVLLGPERKAKALSEKEKKITAYHEAGHAIVSFILPNVDPVRKISIITRGLVGGYTLKLPKKEKYLKTKQEFLEEISVLLAGYITEKKFFKDISTGAASDIKEATNLAFKMVTQFGMSEKLGPRLLIEKEELIFLGKEIKERRNYSEKTAELIDEEVEKIIKNCEKKSEDIIEKNKHKLELISKVLLEKETIEQKEFERLMKK